MLLRRIGVWAAAFAVFSMVGGDLPALAGPVPAKAPAAPEPARSGFTTDSSWVLNPDGTTTRTFYPGRTFRSRAGKWAPIDATVRATDDRAFPFAAQDALRPVLFGSTANALLRLRLDRGDVTVSAPGLTIGKPALTSDGTVLYRDVARDTDLRYRVTSDGVREELVLRSARAPESFRFVVTDPHGALGGIAADKTGAARSALPVADGHRLELAAPYAYEQRAGEATADTGAVEATYRTTGARTEIVKTLDAEWARDRSYPIVVDPTMTFGGPAATTDCHLRSGTLNQMQTFCAAPVAEAGAAGGEARRLLARFDLAGALPAARLTGAALTLTQAGGFTGTTTSFELRTPGRAWTSSATWLSYDGTLPWSAAGGAPGTTVYATASVPPVSGDAVTWSGAAFTDLVKGWLADPATNNGVLVKAVTESGTRLASFAATEHSVTTARPALTLTFSGAPDAPIGLLAQRGDGSASLSWTAPPSNGADITSYTLRTLDANGAQVGSPQTLAGNATTATVGNLTNGQTYSFELVATNSVGDSAPATSNTVVPAGVPGAATGLNVTRGDRVLTVTWIAPPANGAPILDYAVTAVRADDNQVAASETRPAGATDATLTNLVNGVEYVVRVAARNEVGTGDPGEAGPLHPAHTPLGPPSATARALPNGAHLGWAEADGNGEPVTGYRITTYRSDGTIVDVADLAATAREHRRFGLANGQTYDFDVVALNSLGAGAATRTNGVTPDVASKLNLALDPGLVTTVAGDGTAATLEQPRGVVYLGGYTYVGTRYGISRIDTATGAVDLVAGGTVTTSCVNGTGTAAKLLNVADMVTDGTNVYFLACDSVRRFTPSTGAVATVFQFSSGSGLRALTVAQGIAYVSTASSFVWKIDLGTGVRTSVSLTSSGNIHGLAADDTYLYFEHMVSNGTPTSRWIKRWRLDGTGTAEVVFEELNTSSTGTPSTVGLGTLEIAGDYIYGRMPGTGVGSAIRRYHKVTGAATVVAGTRNPGFADASQFDAWFGAIADLASDGSVLYVADDAAANTPGSGHRVRRVAQALPRPRGTTPAAATTVDIDQGVVTTLAGSGTAATTAGTGSAAAFNQPRGIAYLDGYAYVGTADAIQRVEPATGQVTVVAGGTGPTCSPAVSSPTGLNARFSSVADMTTDGQYVYFLACDAVRRLTPATGAVSVVSQFQSASGLRAIAAAPDGYLYVTGGNTVVYKIDAASGARTTITLASNGNTYGLAADDTYLYFEHMVPNGTPTSRWIKRWRLDGTGTAEVVYEELNTGYTGTPATVGLGTLEVAGDYLYGRMSGTAVGPALRRYHKVTGEATVVAGTRNSGHADGTQFDAWFDTVADIASDGSVLYVADASSVAGAGNRIRRVAEAPARPRGVPPTSTKTVTLDPAISSTLAGSGTAATTDGVGNAAAFNEPRAVAYLDGYAYVGTKEAIQRVELATNQVTTLVRGVSGSCTTAPNGSSAEVVNVGDMTTDGQYVYFLACDAVRRLTPATGAVSVVSQFQSASGLISLTAGPDGYLYMSNGNAYVYRIDAASGARTTFLVGPSGDIHGLAADSTYLYFEHYNTPLDGTISNRRIQRWKLDGTGTTETLYEELSRHIQNSPSTIGRGTLEVAGRYLYGRKGDAASAIQRYDKVTGEARTVLGSTVRGSDDGAAEFATFGKIMDFATDGTNLLVADNQWAPGGGNPPQYGNRLRVALTDPMFDSDAEYLGWDPFAGWFEDVNPGLGNFATSATDAKVNTVGPALQIERTYNSADSRVGALGQGWSFEYDVTWSSDKDGNVSVMYSDGRREKFTKNGSAFTAPEGYHATLTSDGSGGYVLTATDGTVRTFGTNRKLTSIADANGRTLTLAYTGGKLTTVTSASGRKLHVAWDGDRISEVSTDPVAAHGGPLTWKYYYDGKHLKAVCDPRDNAITGTCTWYEHAAGRMTGIDKPSGLTDVVVGYLPDGKVQFRGDGLGNVTWFDSIDEDTVEVTDARGNKTRQDYDAKRRLVSETDAYDKATTYEYDAEGHRKSVTDPNNLKTTYTFDANGNVTSTTNAAGETARSTYDSDNNLIASRDARSASATDGTYKTAFTYDTHRNKLTETSPAVPGFPSGITKTWTYSNGTEAAVGGGTMPPGLVRTEEDGRGNTTTYEYTQAGDLARVISATGLTTSYEHDELGRRVRQEVDADTVTDVVTTWTHDELGKQLTQTDPPIANAVSGVTHQLRTTNTYDANGNLKTTTQSDLTGGDAPRTTTYDYDGLDRLVDTFDAQTGKSLHRTYDANGNVATTTDQLGRRYETEYDKNNRPVKVTAVAMVDDPIAGSAPRDVVVTGTTYDDGGRKKTETDAEGRAREFTYDAANRLTHTWLKGYDDRDGTTRDILLERRAYDDAGNATDIWTGGNKRHEERVPDALNRVTTSVLDPVGVNRVTAYTYDGNGNVLTRSVTQDGRTEKTTYSYDEGNVVDLEVVENGALDLSTDHEIDQRGLRIWTVNPRGHRTDYTYDAAGRLVKTELPAVQVEVLEQPATATRPTTRAGYDTFGNVTHAQDANGAVTTAAYDKIDRRVLITHPPYQQPGGTSLTPTESFGYDDVGNLVQRTDRRGNVYDWDFDSRNRVVRQRDPLLTGQTLRGVQRFRYDDMGNLTQAVDQRGARTTFTYDDLDRPRTRTERVRRPGLSDATFTTTLDYDDLGNVTYQRTPAGAVTTMSVNAASEVVSTTDPAGKVWVTDRDVAGRPTAGEDPLGRRVEADYDLAGRLVRERRVSATGTVLGEVERGWDAAGNMTSVESARNFTTTLAYDAADRLTEITEPISATASMTTTYGYDAAGNVTRYLNGEGRPTFYTYTPWQQRESVVEPPTAAHPEAADRTFTTAYDAAGLPVAERQPGVTIDRTFDELGRLTEETGSGTGVATATRRFGYDLAGFRTSVDHPAGTQSFGYDDRGLMTSSTGPAGDTTFAYDDAGRLTRRVDPAGEHLFTWTTRDKPETVKDPLTGLTQTITYDDANQATRSTLPSGARRDVGYDAFGRLKTDTWRDPSAAVTAAVSYGYDVDDNVTSQDVDAPGNPAEGEHQYGYDRAGRLTSWTKPDGSVVEYGWDRAGNRTSAGAATFTYDERNRMLTGAGATYTWTPRGTLASRTQGVATVAFAFDGLGRQTQAGPVSYTYDGLDRLATRTATAPLSSATSTFSYAGAFTDPSTNGESSYARSAGGTLLATREGAGDPALASLNRHGDLAALVDGAGTLVASRVYEPFGVVAGNGGTANPGVGYQADVTDPDTGDVWMGARWYDPADAQFTARDTVFGQLATPVTLNRYTYANGNPLTFHDPTGHCSRHSVAAIQAEQDDEWRDVMAFTAVHECVGAAGQAFSDGFANAGTFLWENTGASDVVECWQGDAVSCGMVALNVVPGGRAAKVVKQTLVRARRSAKVTQRVKNTLNRVQTAARSATSRVKHGPDVRAKTPAHVPNASPGKVSSKPHASNSPPTAHSTAASHPRVDADGDPVAASATSSSPNSPSPLGGSSQPALPPGGSGGLPGSASSASAPRAAFVASSDGVVIPTSRAQLEGGFQAAGFPSQPTSSPGVQYTLPDGTLVRIMEPSGSAPLRASFSNPNGGPINPFTGKPVQPPPGLTKQERLDYVRKRTHVELGP